MEFTSLGFLLFVLVAALLFHLLENALYRRIVLAAASAVFIASYVNTPLDIVPLAAFLLLGYAAFELVRRRPSDLTLGIGLVAVIALFIFLKRFSFIEALPGLPFPYLVLGLSYILFRVLHLIIDARAGLKAAPISPLSFFNYTCGFLSFISGPIQRYEDFARGEAAVRRRPGDALVFRSFSRVVTGFLKVSVVSATANYFFLKASGRLLDEVAPLGTLSYAGVYAAAVVSYTVYLYYNFAGYMDIVIGLGWLFNQELPENFDRPFTARNFLDFWGRWHMTLSEWFKIYVFTPLLKALATRFDSAAALPFLGVLAFFVTFLVMGMWHGTTSVFLVYGLLMGAGASVNKWWQIALAGRLGKRGYKALGNHPLYAGFCRGLTFAYFALALTCLWVDLRGLEGILRRLGPLGIVAVPLLLAVGGGLWLAAADFALARLSGAGERAAALMRGFLLRNAWLAGRILFILVVASFFHRSPEFVYKAF
ncbi:MAG TPA: MBOAT family O-acyltransferase [Stellaceae bacterium]|nr:MBOAT family O-acyltransferase [Stellaceae bacterium]